MRPAVQAEEKPEKSDLPATMRPVVRAEEKPEKLWME
jgi:hypothetical protein